MKKWFVIGGIAGALGAAYAIFKLRQRWMHREEMTSERETRRVA